MSYYAPLSEASGASRLSQNGPVPVRKPAKPADPNKPKRKTALQREVEALQGQQVTALRESTEYGAGVAVRPIQIRRTIVGDFNSQITSILADGRPPAPSIGQKIPRSRATKITEVRETPQRELPAITEEESFDSASQANGNGTVKPATKRKPRPQSMETHADVPLAEDVPAPHRRTRTKREPEAYIDDRPFLHRLGYDEAAVKKLKSWWQFYRLWLFWIIAITILIVGIYSTDNSINKMTGYRVKTGWNKLRNYTPYHLAHPVDWLMDPQIQDLKKRMTAAESDIRQLKIDVKRDHEQIAVLSSKLPEYIVAKKDKYGKIQIPLEFWQAIKDNISKDKDFNKFAPKDSEKTAPVSWKDFERANKANLKKMIDDEVKIHRDDIRRALSDDIKKVKTDNLEEIRALRSRIESHYISKNEQIAPSKLKSMIDEAYSRHNSGSRIEAMINDKIRMHQSQSLRNYNFFAPSQGALIETKYSSPTYKPNVINWTTKLQSGVWAFGKSAIEPHQAGEALRKWDEVGDCWCAVTNNKGQAQMHIRTPQRFYPDEVVVEHVAPESTMDKSAAPKTMDLFINVGMAAAQESGIAAASDEMFADAPPESELSDDWVRIGRWRYDLTSKQEIQVFGLQLKAARYGVKASHFVVRASDNWGNGTSDHTCFYRVRMHGVVNSAEKVVGVAG